MTTQPSNKAAQAAAKILGRITSKRKAAAARRNGRLGGRPRKATTKQGNKETRQ